MNNLLSNKTFLYGAAAAVLVAIVLYFYFSSNTSQQTLTAVQTPTGTAGQSLIIALSNLQAVKLDTKVFSDPVFLSLTDFGVTIAPQPVGRTNPFDTLTGVGSSASVVLPGSIKTGQ